MKVVTWNINGLRSTKNTVAEILRELDADVVCFQETKLSRNLLPEDIALIEGYSSYFSFSRKQSGYSGVATYCIEKCSPLNAEEGLSGILSSENKNAFVLDEAMKLDDFVQPDIYALDSEGRAIITYHEIRHDNKLKTLAIINVYCPCVEPEKPNRHIYKMQFCHLLAAKAQMLSQKDCHVIIVGDLNIAHHVIDHCNPGNEKEFNAKETRQWLTSFLNASSTDLCEGAQFADAFRHLHPLDREAYTCWNTLTGARQTNYGTRIDYILISRSLLPLLSSCEILRDVHGSDHCPVAASFTFETKPSSQLPSICTRFYPEYSGKQLKLNVFLQKSKLPGETDLRTKQESSIKIGCSMKKKNKINLKSEKQKSITNFFSSRQSASQGTEKKEVGDSLISKPEIGLKGGDSSVLNDDVIDKIQGKSNNCEGNTSNNFSVIQANVWKSLLPGPPKPPSCDSHNKPCVLRTVRKEGINFGRQFFACAQPNGPVSNPASKCNFFKWVTPAKRNRLEHS